MTIDYEVSKLEPGDIFINTTGYIFRFVGYSPINGMIVGVDDDNNFDVFEHSEIKKVFKEVEFNFKKMENRNG